jgi:peptide/nickel transport system permease protein
MPVPPQPDLGTGAEPAPAPDGVQTDVVESGPVLRRRLPVSFWISAVFLAVVVLAAITADWLPFVDDVDDYDPRALAAGPSGDHLFGTTSNGNDVLSIVVEGARTSLTVGVFAVAFGFFFGGLLGIVAGYFRGWLDTVISAVIDILLAFPALVLALAIVSFKGPSLTVVTITLGILAIPAVARVARAATLQCAPKEFVLAARTLGASHRRVIVGEILPNVVVPLAAVSLVAVAVVMVAESGLAFLGAGVPADTPSWGSLMKLGQGQLDKGAAHICLFPAAALFLTVYSLNTIGDTLRQRFDIGRGIL